ncbi:MAG: septum formation protein Maf [Chitinispirillaceae bacterium]|nr:septum formation protein Maf [Chitinispirillaceae bacterium]
MVFWKKPGKRIILASASPRRKQILLQMGLNFEIEVPDSFNEQAFIDPENLTESLKKLAEQKASIIAEKNRDALVLGADTIVCLDTSILGKPENREDAFTMIRQLSGKKHHVMTAIALMCLDSGFSRSSVEITEVYFRDLHDSEIEDYLSVDEYKDKAGAYAIQGQALVFIDKIVGCYYNVVGLPVKGTIRLLKEFAGRKEAADV